MSSGASDAGNETGHQSVDTGIEAVDASNMLRTSTWLVDEERSSQLPLAEGEKTPLWMEAGSSSGEHTPTEDKLLGTGWM